MKMMLRLKNFTITLLLVCFFASTTSAQQKEIDKLKSLINKGKMEKAQEYCDKVADPLGKKKSARLYKHLANGYYRYKDYENAAHAVFDSDDHLLAARLAKEFNDKENKIYDSEMAAKLYKKGKKYDLAAQIFFESGKYEEAAQTSTNPELNVKWGNVLFDKGQIDDALHFYRRGKKPGHAFAEKKVLDYYYGKRDYATVYKIQKYKEGNFKMHVQGTVVTKMVEQGESVEYIRKFMDSINVQSSKRDEIFINGYAKSGQFEKAEQYCLSLKQPQQKIGLTYLANSTEKNIPGLSAWANIQLGKKYYAKNQLTEYMIGEALKNNEKWEQEPIEKSILTVYIKEVSPWLKKCGYDKCEMYTHAEKMNVAKSIELNKSSESKAKKLEKATIFIKQIQKLEKCK